MRCLKLGKSGCISSHLGNGYPLSHILLIMDQTRRSIGKSKTPSPNKQSNSSLRVVLPYNKHFAKDLKKTLARYDIETSFRTAPTLKSLLCNTSSKTDPKRTPNCIYKLSCTNCPDFYIGQTYKPISLRIKEHEASYRLNNIYDSATGNIKSAPAKHAEIKSTSLTLIQSRSSPQLPTVNVSIYLNMPPL